LREQADYELTKAVTTNDVDASLKGCRAILIKLKVLDGQKFYPEGYEPVNFEPN